VASQSGTHTVYPLLIELSLCKDTAWKTKTRWEDNITMDLTEIGWEGMDWIYLA